MELFPEKNDCINDAGYGSGQIVLVFNNNTKAISLLKFRCGGASWTLNPDKTLAMHMKLPEPLKAVKYFLQKTPS